MDEENIVYGPYTLPEISVEESQQAEKNNLVGLLQNITNIAIAENAEKSLVQGEIIGRPSIKLPGVQRYDNTCFQYGKNVCVASDTLIFLKMFMTTELLLETFRSMGSQR